MRRERQKSFTDTTVVISNVARRFLDLFPYLFLLMAEVVEISAELTELFLLNPAALGGLAQAAAACTPGCVCAHTYTDESACDSVDVLSDVSLKAKRCGDRNHTPCLIWLSPSKRSNLFAALHQRAHQQLFGTNTLPALPRPTASPHSHQCV